MLPADIRYASSGESGIMSFPQHCPELCAGKGVGIPMCTLSTNCLYYAAYIAADMMAGELELEKKYEKKAAALKAAVNRHFYIDNKYTYMIDELGGCDAQEGMGISFAVLFGIADGGRAEKALSSLSLTKQGIACVMPSFARYTEAAGQYGRHSGTVCPHLSYHRFYFNKIRTCFPKDRAT